MRPEVNSKYQPSRDLSSLAQHDGWLGPLFYWEILRETRKARGYLPRLFYVSCLLLIIYLMMKGREVTLKEAARFGEQLFTYYFLFQYLAVLLLTPIFVAGTFIEDRQQGTLSLLMTTFLSPRELVVGKMMGRLVPMLGVLLAGVPVLAIMQFFGGISFGSLVFQTVNVLGLMLVAGMQSIRCSTLYWSSGTAVFYTYFRLIGSLFLSYIVGVAVGYLFGFYRTPYGLMVFSTVFLAINLWLGWLSLQNAIKSISVRRRGEDRTLPERMQGTQRSPVITEKMEPAHSETDPDEPPIPGLPSSVRVAEIIQEIHERAQSTRSIHSVNPPPYQHWPVVWKQSFFPDRTILTANSLILLIVIFLYLTIANIERQYQVENVWSSYHWTLRMLMSIALMMTMLHATGSLALERTQQTLIGIIAAPMSLTRILLEFAWGAIWRYRWLLALFVALLFVSVVLEQPGCLFWYPLVFFSQLACYTMLALLISMMAQTPFQARILVSIVYFVTMLALPMLFRDWHSVLRVVSMPYASWELIPLMLQERIGALVPELLGGCLLLWCVTSILFLITRAFLRRWIHRA